MANIFQGSSKVAQCVRTWDELMRTGTWIDTEEFARIYDYANLPGEEVLGYEKAIKKAKSEIRSALTEMGLYLRESRDTKDNRKILTAYPEHCTDPLHNMRMMATIDDAMMYSRALRLTYAPSFHDLEVHIFHPQYVRTYNGRQYVYGVYENAAENKGLPFVALPLDRIETVSMTKEVSYQRGNPEEYERQMRNVMGASPDFKHPEVVDVVLRTHDRKTHMLLLTRPLHHSIREIIPFSDEQCGELTIHVQITRELENWILHYGTGIEVIAPLPLRAHIAHVINTIKGYYAE